MIKTIKKWIEAITRYEDLEEDLEDTLEELKEIENQLTIAENKVKELVREKELENYWNNKRVKVNRQHRARDGVMMDVRCFFQRDCTLPLFTGSHDEIAKKALGYVISNVIYTSDKGEFWQYAYETKLAKTGDCEDMAILVANILWNNGIPYWRIRLVKGYVKLENSTGYHAWCTYLAENGEWYVLDAAYWPRESAGLKLKWKEAEKYLTVDASWSPKFSFGGLSK